MLFSFLYTVFAALTSSKTKGAHFFGLWCTLLGFERVKVAPCIYFTIISSSHRVVERGVIFLRQYHFWYSIVHWQNKDKSVSILPVLIDGVSVSNKV